MPAFFQASHSIPAFFGAKVLALSPRLYKTLGIVLCALCVSSCSSSIRFTSAEHSSIPSTPVAGVRSSSGTVKNEEPALPGTVLRGYASYYGDEFQGRLTSNGEVFNQRSFTAAHRTLPFGTKVRVINMRNNRSVFVRINDRGPFADNRVIDLSRAAAEQLDMIKEGVAHVVVTVVEAN